MAPSPKLSILVLTEDSGRDAHATILAVVKRMLPLLHSQCQTQLVAFDPKNEDAQRVVHGTGWKSEDARGHSERATLWNTIATKLDDGGFVFFHIDGDRPWSKRETSENEAKFTAIVRSRVEGVLRLRPKRDGTKRTTGEIEAALARLFPLIPYYSIEAWLYQNTRVAQSICSSEHEGEHVATFEAWAADRTALDEIEKPKENCCLRDEHNLALTKAPFPADELHRAGRSYTAAVDQLINCDELLARLEATTPANAPYDT